MDRDSFAYQAWFGDMRQTLARCRIKPRQLCNIDNFIVQLAGIASDREKYRDAASAEIRPFAETFQHQIRDWLNDGGKGAVLDAWDGVTQPQTVRIGVFPDSERKLKSPEILDTYRSFSERGLFRRDAEGVALFPENMEHAVASGFYARSVPVSLSELRSDFVSLFDPVTPPGWSKAGGGAANRERVAGFADLLRQWEALPEGGTGRAFLQSYSTAVFSVLSRIYWSAPAADGASAGLRVGYPWKLDPGGRMVDVEASGDSAGGVALYSEAIKANAVWRAAAAQRFRDVDPACEFFGGLPGKFPKETEGGLDVGHK
jgi:hypothetical protein